MPGKIFISYRGGDDQGFAGRLFDRLEEKFTSAELFMDIDGIDRGPDLARVLEDQVDKCDVLLVVIGPGWLDARDKEGKRCLDNPEDFVRLEIESGLKLGKLIVPVLVNNADIPQGERLPESLKPLTRRNAIQLTHERFNADALGLIKALKKALGELGASDQAAITAAVPEAKRATTSKIETIGELSPPEAVELLERLLARRGRIFVVSALLGQVLLGTLFAGGEWDWLGAAKPSQGGFATGLLLALALIPISAMVLAYQRRATLRDAEIRRYWLACTLASILALGYAFFIAEWNWVGAADPWAGGLATGFLLAIAIALCSAAVLAYWRRAMLSSAELGRYWLGCTLASIPALGILFGAAEWNWVGAGDPWAGGLATGFLLAFAIVLCSAVAVVYRSRATLSRWDIGRYWVGCTLAAFFALSALFAVNQWNWVGAADPTNGGAATGLLAALTLTLVLSSAAALVSWQPVTPSSVSGLILLIIASGAGMILLTAIGVGGLNQAPRPEAEGHALKPNDEFTDCTKSCPLMVVVPAGKFMMGTVEGGQHEVTIAKPFAIGKYEVTFMEWDACVSAGACPEVPDDGGWGRDARPVINVSWDDAQKYVTWLSRITGKPYRLPSEAEWEYAARAGTTTLFSFGNDEAGLGAYAWYNANSNYKTHPVGKRKPNPFGLHDMYGNVWERVQDSVPRNISGWQHRVIRGGSWDSLPHVLRSAYRHRYPTGHRNDRLGFRVARMLTP